MDGVSQSIRETQGLLMLILWICLIVLEVVLFTTFKLTAKNRGLRALNDKPAFIHTCSALIRLAMGGMFFAACYPKIHSPYGFAELVAQYQLLPAFLVNFFSLWLPVFELLMAVGIIFTKWNKEFSFMVIVLFIIFIIALAQALFRDLGITCGCFDIEGAQDKTGAWVSLLRDIAILPALIWLFKKETNRYIWDFRN